MNNEQNQNNNGTGVLQLQRKMIRSQKSRPPQESTVNLEVPRNSSVTQQSHVINEGVNKYITSELGNNTLKQVKNKLNYFGKINSFVKKSKLNKIKEKVNKFKTDNPSSPSPIPNDKKKEITNAIFEILGEKKKDDPTKQKPNILAIVLIVLAVLGGIVAIIILVVVPIINEKMKEIRNNWPENRCKDPYINFPTIFGPPGTTSEENNAYCTAQGVNSAFNSSIGGIQEQINGQNGIINNITNAINDTQKVILSLKDSLMKQIDDVYQKLYSMFKRIAYLFKVFARLFYRIFQTFNSLFKTVKYAVWTLMSVWTGPIGGLVRAFCFGCHTLIELDGKIKRLDEIVIGDNISGDVVVGVCEFKKDSRDQYYKIGDVYVSGMHIIEYDGDFIRVHSHPCAVKVDYNLPIIRCLITDTGRLRIGKNIYCDYLGDNVLETYLKIVAPIVKIPFLLDDYKNSALNLYPAFTQDSIIQVDSGIKLITDIVIGDKIAGKDIIGVIRYILEGKTFITEYDDGYNMCKFVGIQIYRGDKYIVRENHREMKILGKLECIGLVVDGGVIELSQNMKIVDFDIIGDDMRRDVEDALEKLYLD